MKNIFERLFSGEIYPSEKAVPKTDAYRQDLHELQDATVALAATLDLRQQEMLKEVMDRRESVFYHEYVCIYGEGVRFGRGTHSGGVSYGRERTIDPAQIA